MTSPLDQVLARYGLKNVSEGTLGPVPHQASSQDGAGERQAAERKGWFSLHVGDKPEPDRKVRIPEADYLVLKAGGMAERH
jgi:hypothetical protein